jgi:solute carrier family 25 carnitine/acylcarnitine transporter 20/29
MSIKPHERAYAWSKYISDGGYFDCYRKIKQKEGILGLWKGYSACLIRAFYANAIGFYTYEISKILILEKLGRNNVE